MRRHLFRLGLGMSLSLLARPAFAGDCIEYTDYIHRVGYLDLPITPWDLVISGNLAWVAVGLSGVCAVDIANPSFPTIIGTVNTPSIARQIVVAGTHGFVADAYSGLQVIDISNPTAPIRVGSVMTFDQSYGVAVAGDMAYVADGLGGLH